MDLAFCTGLALSSAVPRSSSHSIALHNSFIVRHALPVRVPVRRARLRASVTPSASGPLGDAEDASTSREGRSDDGSRDSEFAIGATDTVTAAENELLRFVKSVSPPELVARFTDAAPPVVQGAIRQTLMRMLGSLPPLAFSTSVETMSSNLVQLFHSCLISGYMFRNAAYRLELTRSLERTDLPALPARENNPEIQGGVAVFKDDNGAQVEVPVEEYVAELRQTVGALRNEL
eukprot:IDg8842t1